MSIGGNCHPFGFDAYLNFSYERAGLRVEDGRFGVFFVRNVDVAVLMDGKRFGIVSAGKCARNFEAFWINYRNEIVATDGHIYFTAVR